MKKTCLFFLVVGLTFTALQVATVAAQTGMPGGQCDPNPACVENCCPAGDPNASGMPGMGDHQGGMNPQGMPGMGDYQGGMNPQGMTGGQCDPNPACVENCCPAGDPAPDTAPAEDTLLAPAE